MGKSLILARGRTAAARKEASGREVRDVDVVVVVGGGGGGVVKMVESVLGI